jgi:hypothetical protein
MTLTPGRMFSTSAVVRKGETENLILVGGWGRSLALVESFDGNSWKRLQDLPGAYIIKLFVVVVCEG